MSQIRTAVARIRSLTVEPDGKTTVRFWHPDLVHEESFWALLEKAAAQDYAIEIKLIEYPGEGGAGYSDAVQARKSRRKEKP